MDKLINKTVEIALEKGLIEVKNKIIVDSTHTNAMLHHISPREELIRQAKELRKSIYKVDESMHDKMPKKRESSGLLENQIEYTKKLLKLVKNDGRFTALPGIKEQIDYLEETMNDTEIELEYSKDKDAKVGHKTADTSFLGYITHLAMTPERIITAATITTGEKHDGKELINLIEKSENNMKNVSKLSKSVTHGNGNNKDDFEYNKDAGMYVCKAGHMAIKKLYKERYKIEAKNAELKNNYNYRNANACGKTGITIQGATTLFLTNMKRIIKLNDEKKKNIG